MNKNNLDPILKWQGNSLLINFIAVAVNVIGLALIVMGNHIHFEESATSLNILGAGMMIASLVALVLLKGRMVINSFSRVLVGGLFIVSGLVKANDPIGFHTNWRNTLRMVRSRLESKNGLAHRSFHWNSSSNTPCRFQFLFVLWKSYLGCSQSSVKQRK